MILLKFLLIIFNIFVYLLKILEYIYRFQIKEYRWDRLKSYIDEIGWKNFFYTFDLIFPAKKIRNGAIIAALCICSIIYGIYIYKFPGYLILLITLFTPVLAFIDVYAFVVLTSIPVLIYREIKIMQAAKKIAGSETVFIVVSGSYGKTSVKEYLYSFLKDKYNVAKTEKNMNTDIGVALSVLKNLKKNTDYFITEVGAYKCGEIAKICRFVRPSIVIITAFGNQHIDLYGSKEALVSAETEPIDYLRHGGTVYISNDIPEYPLIVKGAEYQIRTVSTKHAADYRAKNIDATHTGVKAEIKTPTDEFPIHTSVLGEHVISNILPALACAMDLGITKSRMRIAVRELEPIQDKLSVKKNKIGTTVISDSSNSNLEGFIQAIRVAATFPNHDKYIVSKGIIELGDEKQDSYERIVKELLKTDIVLLTTDPLFAQLSKEQIILFENESYLKDHLVQYLHPDDLLLIEGRFSPGFLHTITS